MLKDIFQKFIQTMIDEYKANRKRDEDRHSVMTPEEVILVEAWKDETLDLCSRCGAAAPNGWFLFPAYPLDVNELDRRVEGKNAATPPPAYPTLAPNS